MKKYLLALFLFAFASLKGFFELPEEFYVTQRWISLTTTFDVATNTQKLGTVDRTFFSLRYEYNFYDFNNAHQAKARMRWFTFGAIFDVTDADGKILGSVNERILTLFPTFEIVSPSGEILAIASMNLWGTEYSLKDPASNQEIANLSRPFFRLKDNWTVKVTNPSLLAEKKIDPRLFITVMAFQTDMDTWKNRDWLACSFCSYGGKARAINHSEFDEENLESAIKKIEEPLGVTITEENYEAVLQAITEDDDFLNFEEKEAIREYLNSFYRKAI